MTKREQAKRLALHYFEQSASGVKRMWNFDNVEEINALIDAIMDGVKEELREELKKEIWDWPIPGRC